MSKPDKANVTEPDDLHVHADAMPLAAKAVRLQREALLPAERRGNMSHVTAACLMTGVASGLALATTLMAMQVADSVATQKQHRKPCAGMAVQWRSASGFLGIQYSNVANGAKVEAVVANTPADFIGLQSGDTIESIDGLSLAGGHRIDLKRLIQTSAPGTDVYLSVNRDGTQLSYRAQLTVLPTNLR